MRIVALAAMIFLSGGIAYAAEPAQIARGKALSIQLCAGCHQISPTQRRPMRVYNAKTHTDEYAATFMEIAKGNGRDARNIDQALTEPHYPMRRKVFSASEREDIIAYIQSLGS